ncbi:hypothetical protein OEZ85_014219 [Tetradesmus obliquus]|uniref:Uncharacterized protein n=1 Tax=Tetradesmus obliquus TaxID=3088 RepID=A0ABY8UAE3_TETOB|nr:hypothetical protein OEZ85_014219 [Tetradesmus obliquus]
MEPNNDVPQRSRRAVKRSFKLQGYVTVDSDASKRQRPASAGSGQAQDSAAPRSHAGAQLDPEPASEHSDDEESSDDQQHDSGDEEMADSDQQKEGLEGDLRQDELEELVERVNDKRRPGTRTKYSGNQKVWMRWCVNGGFLPNSKSISVDLKNEVAARGPLTRFMKWYVAGRAGDTVKSGRKASSASGELLRDAAVNMHSALQQLVDNSCRRAGKAPWILREAGRTAATLTPGGHHFTAFMTGREDQLPFVQQQQQPLQQQQQQLQQQSDERPPGLSDAEWHMVVQLRQQQQRPPGLSDEEWQLLLQTRQARRQAQARQQQQQQGRQFGSSLLQGMGTVEPLGEIALPHITAQGAAAAALGAAGARTATTAGAGGSVPIDGLLEVLLDMRQLITQGQQGCSCAGMQQQQQQCEDHGMGEAGGAGEVLQQQHQKQQQQQKQPSKNSVKPFPSLSVHTSMEALAHWYAVQPHHSEVAAGRTIKQMEDDGSHSWRAGGSKQRWSEYMVLLTALEEKQEQLVDAQRRLGRRGVQVDMVAAAQKLDEERLALPNPNPKSSKPMSICQFREHLTAQAHAAAAARLAAEEAEAPGAEQQ